MSKSNTAKSNSNKSNTTKSRTSKSNIAYFDYIPNEVLCKIANDLTKPKDIAHFMQTYKRGAAVAKDCVTVINSKSEEVPAKFILQFPNLREVNVKTVYADDLTDFLLLRFKRENYDSWNYDLIYDFSDDEALFDSYNSTEKLAYDNNYSDDFIFDMLALRTVEQREYVEPQLLSSATKRPYVSSKKFIYRLLKETQSDQTRDIIFDLAMTSNDTKLLKILKDDGFIVEPHNLHSLFRKFFAFFMDKLPNKIFLAIKFLIENDMIDPTKFAFVLDNFIHGGATYKQIKYLVDAGFPVRQQLLDQLDEEFYDEKIINYLRQHLSE